MKVKEKLGVAAQSSESYSAIWRGAIGVGKPAQLVLRSVGFAALLSSVSMVGEIQVPGTPVPITLQTLILMVGALTLSWREVFGGTVLYLSMGAVGIPVFAGGASTVALFGPSAGWLLGFVPGAVVSAWCAGLVKRFTKRTFGFGLVIRYVGFIVAAVVGCIGVVYVCGILIQAVLLQLPVGTVATTSAVFLVGDTWKALTAAAIAVLMATIQTDRSETAIDR